MFIVWSRFAFSDHLTLVFCVVLMASRYSVVCGRWQCDGGHRSQDRLLYSEDHWLFPVAGRLTKDSSSAVSFQPLREA